MTPLEMIAAERFRQIEVKGWTPEHDDTHAENLLSLAARTYIHANLMLSHTQDRPDYNIPQIEKYLREFYWPFEGSALTVSPDPLVNLTKATALLVADMERQQRKNGIETPDSMLDITDLSTARPFEVFAFMKEMNAGSMETQFNAKDGTILSGVIYIHGQEECAEVFEAVGKITDAWAD